MAVVEKPTVGGSSSSSIENVAVLMDPIETFELPVVIVIVNVSKFSSTASSSEMYVNVWESFPWLKVRDPLVADE